MRINNEDVKPLDQVQSQFLILGAVWYRVLDKINRQTYDQVLTQIKTQVQNRIWWQFWSQIYDKVNNKNK